MRAIALSSILLSSLTLIACGDDGGDGNTPIDAKTIDTAAANCTVSSASFGARGALAGNSFYGASMGNPAVGSMVAVLPLEAAEPTDVVIAEFYPGFAPFGTQQAPTAIVPGTYQLTGSQLQYADCGVCIRIGTNSTAAAGAEDDYMATGGTVTVTQSDSRVGGTLAFSVTGLTFEHVTIAPQTFVSTPVGDGCNSAIASAMHSSVMAAQPNKPGQATPSASVKRPRI